MGPSTFRGKAASPRTRRGPSRVLWRCQVPPGEAEFFANAKRRFEGIVGVDPVEAGETLLRRLRPRRRRGAAASVRNLLGVGAARHGEHLLHSLLDCAPQWRREIARTPAAIAERGERRRGDGPRPRIEAAWRRGRSRRRDRVIIRPISRSEVPLRAGNPCREGDCPMSRSIGSRAGRSGSARLCDRMSSVKIVHVVYLMSGQLPRSFFPPSGAVFQDRSVAAADR